MLFVFTVRFTCAFYPQTHQHMDTLSCYLFCRCKQSVCPTTALNVLAVAIFIKWNVMIRSLAGLSKLLEFSNYTLGKAV